MMRPLYTKAREVITDELVFRTARGDLAARDELVSICLPRVWRTVHLSCGVTQDAEDMVQTAVMDALNRIGTYSGPDRFCAWLDTLTVNVVKMHFRKKKPWLLFGAEDGYKSVQSEPWIAPDRRYESKRLWNELLGHISRIKPKNRIAMVLALFYGYRASVIAEMVGCTPETAQKRSRRGFMELEKAVGADRAFSQAIKELAQ